MNRASDYVFRLGGEEFGVFIECKSLENAEVFLKRLKFAVLGLKIKHNESLINEYLSISMGAVFIDNAYNLEIEDIYKKADKLLYKAKEEGRNRFFIKKI
ncbi:MAG: GGDEF domain-containing protein [Poseidonibacter sp.]